MDEQETNPVETEEITPEVTETPDETEEVEIESSPVSYHTSDGAPVTDRFLVQ